MVLTCAALPSSSVGTFALAATTSRWAVQLADGETRVTLNEPRMDHHARQQLECLATMLEINVNDESYEVVVRQLAERCLKDPG